MLMPEVLQIEQTDCTMGNYQYIVTVEYVFMQMESWPMHPVNNPKRYGSFDDHEWILNYFSAPITVEAE
jgi:hypothetical protein